MPKELKLYWLAAVAGFLALSVAFANQDRSPPGEVDLLLVMALDVSGSVDDQEYALQREGLARALSSRQVVEAIAAGVNGSIAVTVVQWSGFTEQIVKIDWQKVANASDLSHLADQVRTMTRRYKNGATDIGGVLDFSQQQFKSAPYSGRRQIIDIVGDGTNNVNFSPHIERDRVVKAGSTINALAIVTASATLFDYFRNKVIGGPGAFVETALDYNAFELAMRRKLVREITEQLLF